MPGLGAWWGYWALTVKILRWSILKKDTTARLGRVQKEEVIGCRDQRLLCVAPRRALLDVAAGPRSLTSSTLPQKYDVRA